MLDHFILEGNMGYQATLIFSEHITITTFLNSNSDVIHNSKPVNKYSGSRFNLNLCSVLFTKRIAIFEAYPRAYKSTCNEIELIVFNVLWYCLIFLAVYARLRGMYIWGKSFVKFEWKLYKFCIFLMSRMLMYTSNVIKWLFRT